MNQKQRGLYLIYLNASATKLRDVYRSWSDKKEQVMTKCLRDKLELNGYDGKIPSANSYSFTYAFCYKHPDTNKEHLRYYTHHKCAHIYDFCIEEDK